MPCFHLNLVADDVLRDDEGQDLPDLDAAIQMAIIGARELIADLIVSGKAVHLDHRIDIADVAGRVVYTLAFADVVRIIA